MIKFIFIFILIILIILILFGDYSKRFDLKEDNNNINHVEKELAATKLLKRFSDILNNLNINWFLSDITQRAYYNCGSFFEPDSKMNRISIGILAEEYKSQIVQQALQKGFILQHRLGSVTTGMVLIFKLQEIQDIRLDLKLYYNDKNANNTNNTNKICYWYNDLERTKICVNNFKLKPIIFKGIKGAKINV